MHRRNLKRLGMCGVVAAAAVALTVPSAPAPTSAAGIVPSAATSFTPTRGGQAPCPEGRSRSSTVYEQGFESGIPESRYNVGFARFADATSGRYSARSSLSGTSGTSEHFFLPYREVPEGATTYLGFTAKGGSVPAAARVVVNSVLTTLSTQSTWRGITVDVTAATRDEGGWLSTWFEHRARSGAYTSLLIDDAQLYRCRVNATTRVAAADRFATAAELSEDLAPGVGTLYVASGLDYPDAVSAAPVAGSSGSRILLVRSDSIPGVTARALSRLTPRRIVVLGGSSAVSGTVERALRSYAPTVQRIGGRNRYETAALVSRHFSPGVKTAYIATGTDFADALSGGALAGYRDSPLMLVEPYRVPDAVRTELTRLAPDNIVVFGGAGAVSNTVVSQLRSYTTGSVSRIEGEDRYAVSAAIASKFWSPSVSYLATGTTFADGVTGAAAAGAKSAPLLLSRPDDLPPSVRYRLGQLRESRGVVLGGVRALQPIVRDQYGRTLP